MEPQTPAAAVAELLNSLNKGQYLILTDAIRQLGGELRLDWEAIAERAKLPPTPLDVDGSDGPIVVRLADA